MLLPLFLFSYRVVWLAAALLSTVLLSVALLLCCASISYRYSCAPIVSFWLTYSYCSISTSRSTAAFLLRLLCGVCEAKKGRSVLKSSQRHNHQSRGVSTVGMRDAGLEVLYRKNYTKNMQKSRKTNLIFLGIS